MIDSLLEKLLTQGSPLIVLVAVVIVFLRHIATEAKQMRGMFAEMHLDHMTARREMRETMEKNTLAMVENTVAMRGLSAAVGTCPLKV